MTHYVFDTNVPVVANGRGDYDMDCRLACVEQIEMIRKQLRHRVVLDSAGAILDEYHRYLNPRGQPGVGDQFYRHLLNFRGNRKRVLEVDLEIEADTGEYSNFPTTAALAKFDRSDRKFVVASIASGGMVVNATDGDWNQFKSGLRNVGVKVKELCPACIAKRERPE